MQPPGTPPPSTGASLGSLGNPWLLAFTRFEGEKKGTRVRSRLRCPRGARRNPRAFSAALLSSVSCYPAGHGDKRALEKPQRVEGLLSCLPGPLQEGEYPGFHGGHWGPTLSLSGHLLPPHPAPLAGCPRVPRAAFGAADAQGHFWNTARGGWEQRALPREQLALEKRGIQGHSCFLGSTECQHMGLV